MFGTNALSFEFRHFELNFEEIGTRNDLICLIDLKIDKSFNRGIVLVLKKLCSAQTLYFEFRPLEFYEIGTRNDLI